MNILELAILKKMVGGGGGSGTDNYNDLSNLPQINDETLAGNKTAENLGLQDALTFDSAPTEDSTNPVESGGVYNALAGKQDNLTFDDDPTENSTNPVKSGGVYNALAGKQDNLTFDGVYNASTNKAATESTVTNAIAGLDVSALSVDADETISSISETDGKISVTKQDIAIASNQVTAMTGYTKPSSAPATPAIQQDDTANAAIGKLEYKADVNQTNILYSINTGVKNLFNPIDEFSGSSTISTINNGDGTYKITGGSNIATVQYASFFLKAGTYVLSGCPENGSDNTYRLELRTEPSTAGIIIDYGTGATAIIENSGYYLMAIRLAANYTAPSSGLLFKPMICEKSVWDSTNHDFQPPALPNYDLTRLEAEDRAALAEEIDSGAKNEFEFGEFTDGGAGESITISGQSVTVTNSSAWAKAWRTFRVTKNTTYVLSFRVTNVATVAHPNYRVSLGNNHHYSGSYYGIITCDTTGNYYLKFTPPTDTDIYLVINSNYTSTAASDMPSITVDNIMVCTEADWKISQNFVPYRPDYDTLISMINAKEPALSTTTMDNGSLDDITVNSFIVCSWNVSSKPISTMGFVRTSVFDANSAMQEFYSFSGDETQSCLVYVRDKQAGVWRSWKMLTNNT